MLGDARAPRHGQQHGSDRDAEEHGPARSGLVEQRLRQSRPELNGEGGAEHEERGRHGRHRSHRHNRTVAAGYEQLEDAFREIDAPFALVDLDAMWSNAAEMLTRAGGRPIRVASKSVRCRPLLSAILERDPGFRGLMTFTFPRASGSTSTASATCCWPTPPPTARGWPDWGGSSPRERRS